MSAEARRGPHLSDFGNQKSRCCMSPVGTQAKDESREVAPDQRGQQDRAVCNEEIITERMAAVFL